jgi:hypothetical protein
LNKAYLDGIARWTEYASSSPHEEVRQNAQRFLSFLKEDLEVFRDNLLTTPSTSARTS